MISHLNTNKQHKKLIKLYLFSFKDHKEYVHHHVQSNQIYLKLIYAKSKDNCQCMATIVFHPLLNYLKRILVLLNNHLKILNNYCYKIIF